MSGYIPATQLASAYPSPDLPAAQMAMMIIVPVGLLFVWLTLVYLAARPGRERRQPPLRPQAPLSPDSHAAAAPDTADAHTAGTEPQLTRSARS